MVCSFFCFRMLMPAVMVGVFVVPAFAQIEYAYETVAPISYENGLPVDSTVLPAGATVIPDTLDTNVVWADGSQWVGSAPVPSVTSPAATNVASNVQSSGLAQQKAATAARMGLRGHVGGSLGGARCEGVGWSSQSAQAAIQQCCYWGTRPVSQIGVARGSDGCWYACVLYR